MSGWAMGISAAVAVASTAYTMSQGTPEMHLPAVNTTINTPAQNALASRTDTGANVKLGSTVKDQRVSGARTSSGGTKTNTVDILGGLGGGGGLSV